MLIDIVLTIDGLDLNNKSVDEFIKELEDKYDPAYPILYEMISHE